MTGLACRRKASRGAKAVSCSSSLAAHPQRTMVGARSGRQTAQGDAGAGDGWARLPFALPGGRALLYTVRKRIWTWGDEQVVVQPLPAGQPVLLTDAADARYLPTGHLVFLRRGTLWAVPFDLDRL